MVRHESLTLTIAALQAVALLSGQSAAQSFDDNTIVGCDVVDCPVRESSTQGQCQVVEDVFTNVGVARIPFDSDSPLHGLTWTEGAEIEDTDDGRVFDTRFYLGTPSNFSLSGFGGCAVFFRRTSENVFFRTGNPNITQETQGPCEDALSDSCVSALNRRAAEFEFESSSIDETCSDLGRHFLENFDEDCGEFAVNGNWSEITVTPIAGPDAPQPIGREDNSTSTCWPVVPKSHDLRLVESFREEGSNYANDMHDLFFSVHPILTVFFPQNSSVLTDVESRMTCMKTLEANDENQDGRSDGNGENASNFLGPDRAVGLGMVLALTALHLL